MINKVKRYQFRVAFLFIVFFVGMSKCTYAKEDKLHVIVTSADDEKIIIKKNTPLYTATPVCFSPQINQGEECYYKASIDKGETFGGKVFLKEKSLTIYPSKEDSQNDYVFKFGVVRGDDGSEIESDTYRVIFDRKEPIIVPDNKEVLSRWIQNEEQAGFTVEDVDGLISRIVVKSKGEIVHEEKYNYKDGMKKSVFAIDLNEDSNNGYGSEIEIEAFDLANNSIKSSFSYYLDRNKPEVNIEGIENAKTYSADCFLNFDVKDEGSGLANLKYKVCRTVGDKEYLEDVVLSKEDAENISGIDFNEDGDYDVSVVAVDKADNKSEEKHVSFRIDKTPPVVRIEGVSNNVDFKEDVTASIIVEEDFFNECNVSINVIRKRQDDVKTLSVESFAPGAPYDSAQISLVNDGDYDIYVTAMDSAGAVSEAMSSFRIDKTAPKLTVCGIKEGEVTSKKPVLRIGMSDIFYDATILDVTLYEHSLENIFIPVDSKKCVMKERNDYLDYEVASEGNYRLICKVADRSGNENVQAIDFVVDYTPPVIADLSEFDGKFLSSFVMPGIKSLISDNSNYEYEAYINDRNAYENDVVLEDGKYVLWISAKDEANNISTKTASFVLDHVAPQIVIGGMRQDGYIKKGKEITFSLNDEEDFFEKIVVNGEKIQIDEENKKAKYKVKDYGDFEVEIVANDNAGNKVDKVIHTACVMAKNPYADYVKKEKIISSNIVENDKNENNFLHVYIGVITVLCATMTLVFRGLRAN